MEQDFRATQFVGSQAEAEVLLEQPRAEILLKQSRRRGRRQENEYLIGFEGYPDSDSYWVKEQTVRRDPNGPQLIAEYEAAIEQEEAAFDGQANSSDEDMTSVDIQGNVGEQRLAVRPALDIANQISTQQPSEPQLPQTQPPSQVAALPALARTAPATQEPEPAWEDQQRSDRSKQFEAAYRRELQAGQGRPAVLRPPQRSSVLNGLPTSLWENSPLVTRRSPVQQRAAAARPPQQIAAVQQHGSHLQPRHVQPAQVGPSYAAEDWGFDDADEPSQEDLAAADWAAQHAAPQRPANAMVPARQSHPVGPQQIGFLAADPFGRQSPGAAAQAIWPPVQRSRLGGQFTAAMGPSPSPDQPRHLPSSFTRNRNSHWLGPGGAHAQPLLTSAAPRSIAGPLPSHQFHQSLQPASWARHDPLPGSSEPVARPRRQDFAVYDAPALGPMPARVSPGGAPQMVRGSAAEPPRQPLGPLPLAAQQARAAAPLQADQAPHSLPSDSSHPAAIVGSPPRQEPVRASWYDSIAMQLPGSRQPAPSAAPARAAEQPPRLLATAFAEPPALASASGGEGEEAVEGLPPPRQWPAQQHPSPPQRLQSPVRPTQPAAPAAPQGAPAKRPVADHQGLFNALGRRAAEMIRQAPPATEGAEDVPAEGHPQMEHVQRETWRAWATRLQVLGGTVAAYAAAQDLPAEVAARAGAQGAPLVDLNALPAVRAQPEEAEEPIEEFIDVPSLPAAEEGTRKRDAVEPQRGRRPLKRLKRIYQSEAGEEDPAPEVESPELVPDSSEEAGKQEPAARQAHQGGGQATPLRPGRHLHILEDGEDAEEEADAAAEPEDDGQLDEEAPMHQIDEADSNDYGLNPEQLWHLQPEHWRGAVINRARHEADDVLLLRIRWPDGFNSWVNRFALHVRPHCHMALIDFYESKAKPKK